jgi:hypothetical protein
MRRPAVRAAVLAVCGLFVTLPILGCSAARTASTTHGTVQECKSYAVYAIQRHITATRNPPQCAGLTPIVVNEAVESAIQQESGNGPKPERRQGAGEAVRWVSALLSASLPPAVAGPGKVAPTAAGNQGSTTGGVSDLSLSLAALAAWAVTAASGAYLIWSWLLAGGDPRRRKGTAAPPEVMLAHAGSAITGLVLWISFLATSVVALAWAATALLVAVAGLGMGLVTLGLPFRDPSAAGRPAQSSRPRRAPVLIIAVHGVVAFTTLLLVLLAAIGAGGR